MSKAAEYLRRQGYDVENVSKSRAYDFIATRGDESLIVEVKGSTCNAGQIVVTYNEVLEHGAHHPNNLLLLIHSIELDRTPGHCKATGGILVAHNSWIIDASRLKPIAYSYLLE